MTEPHPTTPDIPDPKSLDEVILLLQSDPPVIVKNKDGQAGNQKTRYADLVQVYGTVMPRITAYGVIWTCSPDLDGERFVLRWELKHIPSGDVRTGRYPLGVSDNPQQLGSRQSYATRYAFLRVLGLAVEDEDDDGSETPRRPAQRRARTTPDADTGPTTPRERRPAAETADQGDPNAVSEPQQRKLAIQFRDLEVTDRDQRLALMTDMLGRPIGSIKDLTKREASAAIDAIDKALKTDNPLTAMIEIYQRTQGTEPPPAGRPPGQRSRNAREAVTNNGDEGTEPAPWEGQLQ